MLFTLTPRKRAYLKGYYGEWVAALYLRCKGYKILKTRLKTPVGEIDLLTQKGRILVVVEVKSRSSIEAGVFAITPYQQRRIERALLYYLSRKLPSKDIRFDVILIAPWKWPYHLKGAW